MDFYLDGISLGGAGHSCFKRGDGAAFRLREKKGFWRWKHFQIFFIIVLCCVFICPAINMFKGGCVAVIFY